MAAQHSQNREVNACVRWTGDKVTSLTGHFGGLGSLVHRTVHVFGVRTSALVVGGVGTSATFVGVGATAVALVGVRPAAVAIEGGDAGSGCRAGTDQAGHAGRGH